MKTFLKKLKTRAMFERMLDALSLGAVLQYCLYRFLQSTMFNFYYSNTYKLVTMGLLLVFGGVRYLYVVVMKWRGKNKKERKSLFYCVGAWFLALPFFYVGWLHDYKNLIFLPICCMCLYDMKAGKILKSFVLTIGIALSSLVLCCLSGTVRNLVSQENFVSAYGVINTTDFASYFSFLLLLSWCGLRGRKWQTSLLFVFFTLIITFGVYKLTESRTLLYTGGLMVLFALWDCLERSINRDKRWFRQVRETVKWISILAFPIIGVLVIYLTAQYAAGEPWARQLNATLSERLSTVLIPYRIYGIAPFGNTIEKMHGQGGTILGQFWTVGYSYLDVAYAMLAIRYGWIITAIVTGLWIWTTVKAFKSGKNRIGYALAIMAVHAFSEARTLDANYNILLIMPFCLFVTTQEATERIVPDKKTIIRPLLVGTLIAGITWIALPRGLSWLRTFFYLKGWNSGTASFKSFVLCVGIVIVILMLWKIASSIWNKPSKKLMIPLAGLLTLGVGGVLIINGTIEQGRAEQADRLNMEEKIIQTIQESATMPIYAADSEELYRRDGVRTEGHVFSNEELGKHKGTIIVDSSVYAPNIILSGGMYAQISDHAGIYTFDPAVIENLRVSGFTVGRSYTGIQHCNLKDLALYNDIKMEDQLQIDSKRITTSNAETDQLFGRYEVTFSFSGLSTSKEGDVILLEVLGEHGEKTVLQEMLTTDDFDSEGKCEYTLTYQTNPSPGVSYAITPMKDVRITVDDISWKRSITPENEDLLHNTILINQHESAGVNYKGNPDGTLKVKGEATGISAYNIYVNKNGFPDWMQKGKEYVIQIDDPEEMVSFELYLYDADENIVFPALVSTRTCQELSLPDYAHGIIIRFRAWDGKLVDTTVTPVIYEKVKP